MVEIFIVDPHHITRRGLVTVLSAETDLLVKGETHSLEEAMRAAAHGHIDVIVVDLPLLGAPGRSLVKQMRTRLPECKIVVFSAHDEDEHLIAALNAGVHAFICKGSSAELLKDALRSVAAGACWMDPIIARRLIEITAEYAAESMNDPGALEVPVGTLSEREVEVLWLLTKGMGNRQIAAKLSVSTDTVKSHVRHILDKLNATSRTDAAVKAVRAGLVGPAVKIAG